MARKGRAGPALGISAIGSFIGGTFSVIALMLFVIPLSKAALRIGPPEYFALVIMGMTTVTYLSTESFLKGVIMVVVGLFLSCVGTDLVSGKIRFAYGIIDFYDGIDLVPLVIGLFGISEVLSNIEEEGGKRIFEKRVKNLLPNREDWKKSTFPIVRGSILGFLLGLIPGGGTILASFFSYTVEKKVSREPEKFGKGAIEGVAGPETANNAAVGGAFVPLFALGIPSNVVMALLLAAFVVHGVAPSPGFIAKNPELFWGIIASMYVGNIMLLVLNLPLIGVWVKILEIPYKILFPLILLFCVIGAYSINNKTFDIMVMVIFGLVGFFMRKCGFEPAPLILAFVLGPILEYSFRQSMILGSHNLGFIFSKPIAIAAFAVTFFIIFSNLFMKAVKFRHKIVESSKD